MRMHEKHVLLWEKMEVPHCQVDLRVVKTNIKESR